MHHDTEEGEPLPPRMWGRGGGGGGATGFPLAALQLLPNQGKHSRQPDARARPPPTHPPTTHTLRRTELYFPLLRTRFAVPDKQSADHQSIVGLMQVVIRPTAVASAWHIYLKVVSIIRRP